MANYYAVVSYQGEVYLGSELYQPKLYIFGEKWLRDTFVTANRNAVTTSWEIKAEDANKFYSYIEDGIKKYRNYEDWTYKKPNRDLLDKQLIRTEVVRLAPSYCKVKERKNIYAVTQVSNNVGKCYITCLNSGKLIAPTEEVTINMIERTGFTMKDLWVAKWW